MTVSCIDPAGAQWQAFVASHPNASVFHTPQWLEALRRTYGYEPVVYAKTDGDRVSSGIPFCRIRSRLTGSRLVSLPFSDHCQPLIRSVDDLHSLLNAAKDDALRGNYKYIELRPLTPYSHPAAGTAELNPAHDAVIHRLDLRRNREDIMAGFHKQCIRRKITRSEREQLRYEEGRSAGLLKTFYRLLLLTRRRHQLPPQPLSWFQNLMSCLGEMFKIRVATLTDGTPVASIVTLSFRQVATYKYGCSDARFNACGGMVMLMWRAIQDALNDGATELDLGRSDPDTPGLITFKDHWGAAQSPLTYYRYPDTAKRTAANRLLVGSAKRLVTVIPDPLFTTLGGLIYRHVG